MKTVDRIFSKKVILKNKIAGFVAFILAFIILSACEEFLEIDPSASRIIKSNVFSNDATATSAIIGIYYDMLNPSTSFAYGGEKGLGALAGLSADEWVDYNRVNTDKIEFQENNLRPENSNVSRLWTSLYKTIYQANSLLEGLVTSDKLSVANRNQLKGEALFIRAFCHFYLVNLFGDVPIVTETDFRKNSIVERKPIVDVYDQIINDLKVAREVIGNDYVTTGRVRPNRAVVTALLARVYLYQGNWGQAEAQASEIISNSVTYALESDLDNVFLSGSIEAIWQLMPVAAGFNTYEGIDFNIVYWPNNYVLHRNFLDAFESSDKRKSRWVRSFDTGSELVYFPHKYKVYTSSNTTTEFSVLFRLAEQYLIRAEARVKRGNVSGGIFDVDVIRNRAGLPLLQTTNPNIGADSLLLVIEHERQIELFTEWGHRWLDLKRSDRVIQVLSSIKTSLTIDDALYPIPQSEFDKNLKLGNQNYGY